MLIFTFPSKSTQKNTLFYKIGTFTIFSIEPKSSVYYIKNLKEIIIFSIDWFHF